MINELYRAHSRLSTRILSRHLNWANHNYSLHFEDGLQYFRRDGVDWGEVTNVTTDLNIEEGLPLLTIEAFANIKQFKNDNLIKLNNDGICDYSIEYTEGFDTCKVYRNGEYLEDVVAFEIEHDSKKSYLTKIRLTVIGNVKIEWDQSEYKTGMKLYYEYLKNSKEQEA